MRIVVDKGSGKNIDYKDRRVEKVAKISTGFPEVFPGTVVSRSMTSACDAGNFPTGSQYALTPIVNVGQKTTATAKKQNIFVGCPPLSATPE